MCVYKKYFGSESSSLSCNGRRFYEGTRGKVLTKTDKNLKHIYFTTLYIRKHRPKKISCKINSLGSYNNKIKQVRTITQYIHMLCV